MPTVKKQKTPAEALASLVRLCSRAEKSSGDARRLMRGWGIEKGDAENILAELTTKKFIDDERFAAAYTREKLRTSGWGAHKIRAALTAKGIARDIADSALEELDPEAQTDRLEKYLTRKRSRIKATTPHDMRSKLIRYGLSLGYDYDTVAHALGQLLVVLALLIPTLSPAQNADYYRSPLDIPVYLSANFGEIRTNRFHTGIDIKTQGVVGKPLYAAADGHISRVTVAPTGYGRALYIAHPNGTTTVYAHMDSFTDEIENWLRTERYRLKRSDLDAFPDQGRFPVKKGDRIGTAGNSGSSTGPHLHYEVRRTSSSRALNIMANGWVTAAEPDRVPPRIVRLYHIDVDTIAGVPVHSQPRPHDVKQNPDGTYSLVRTTPLKAAPTGYFVIEATDRRSDVTNTFGIHRARMAIDGDEKVLFEKDGMLFDEVRYACASVLYEVQRKARGGNEAVMLAVKSGNRLPMYKKATDRGVITFRGDETAPKTVVITVEDDAGNTSLLTFAVEPDPARAAPQRPQGRIAPDTGNFVHFADSLAVSIPKGALYEPIFYTQSVVETTVPPRSDGIRPLSPLLRTGDGIRPLHSAMRLGITADIPENLRRGACLARVSEGGALSYAGGTWSNGSVNGSSRDFGTFCVVVDSIAPTVRALFADGADLTRTSAVTITATDNFSGITNFTGTIDGEWIIFERNASGGQFIHRFDAEKLRAGRTHTFEFTCRDGAGNTSTRRWTFYK